MQFAVILHECFKCHSCYSTSIKVGWMANTLSSKEMFYSGSPGIIDTEVTSLHLCMHTHTENTHTVNQIAAHMLHWIYTYTQSVTYEHMQSHRDVFVSLSLVSTSNFKSSFVRSLHVLPLTYKGSELSWPSMTRTHGHTLIPPTTLCAVIGKLTGQQTVAQLGR